jgi:hypothetical protein
MADMWDRIDALIERAPHEQALRLHRVELLESRRRRAAGLALGRLAEDDMIAIACDLAATPLLTRVRNAYDGPLVLVKGAEVALDYPEPRLRRFRDLDLLTDDAEAAQAALIAAGFQEVGDPRLYRDIHHLRPLWWPGLPLVIELHSRPKWIDGIPEPSIAELLVSAVPSRLDVEGLSTLPAAHHALVLAAHAWAHEPLGRLGQLIDVAVTLRRGDEEEIAALARDWGCSRMWRTTLAAVRSVIEGEGRSTAVTLWATHLAEVRERTVFEWHLKDLLAPLWGLPPAAVPGALLAELRATSQPEGPESWRAKVTRARLATRNAGLARSEHNLVVAASDRGDD